MDLLNDLAPLIPVAGGVVGGVFGGPAGAAVGAGLGSSFMNYQSQQQTNQQNINLSREQMEFQQRETDKARVFEENMANTAHQRQIKDLMAAGLNPNLAATGGAPVPSVAAPSGSAATLKAPEIILPDLMSFGISLKQLEQTDQRLAIDKANSAANIAKTMSDTDLNKAKKILLQKGMLRAELEGQTSEVLTNIIKFLKKSARQQPKLNNNGKYKTNTDRFMDSGFFDTPPSMP